MLPFLQTLAWPRLLGLLALAGGLLAGPPARAAHPQSNSLAGQVRNKANQPLPGVVIELKGNPASTITNATGNFWLSCEQPEPVLTFKCVGYQTQTLLVKTHGVVGITLYEVGTPILPPPPGLEMVLANEQVDVADEPPMYPGGVPAYRAYMQQNLRYPDEAKAKGLSGTVLIGFIVDEKGRILEAEVAKGCGAGLDQEALRLVRLMPWWQPGRRAGQPVRVASSLRIRFEFQEKPAATP